MASNNDLFFNMKREIKAGLFGEGLSLEQRPEIAPIVESNGPGLYYEELSDRIDRARFEAQEWVRSLSVRLEKTLQRTNSVEDRMKQISAELHERITYVAARIKDKNGSDMKIEALIERHNQIVQSFELRLSQAQRLVENQAIQLSKQQELIDDARRQIEKLKKL